MYQTEEDEPYGGGLDGRWTAWGRGSFLQFDGLDPAVGVSGEVFNMTAGFDYETGPVIGGLALAGSVGTGDYHVAGTEIQSERMGEIWSILGSVHPYVHVSLAKWLRVWGLGGIGSGTLRISGSEQDADLRMRMWAFGGRSDLRVPALDGLRFALKSDVFWVEMDSDATDTRRASTAEARRLRLMLESTFRVISFWGGEFAPLLEAGLRDDAGDAETGRGLEVASGFRYPESRSGIAWWRRPPARWYPTRTRATASGGWAEHCGSTRAPTTKAWRSRSTLRAGRRRVLSSVSGPILAP